MTYKPEIDGLRAVAVLLVLLCHVGLAFPGGYIGVDVFFVISGFLITSILVSDYEQGRFNLVRFYAKRFIRLYPALLVVIVLVFAAAFCLADQKLLKTVLHSGSYATASISNAYFSKNLGYFDLGTQFQPFLHTWTLGVEWQYYLLAPVLIWILLKHSKEALIIGLAVVAGFSLMFSQIGVEQTPKTAYYLLPYRAFELCIGSLLVFIYHRTLHAITAAVLCIVGLIAILAAAFLYSAQTPFPGYAALLPTVGAAAVIYGAGGFAKGNLLRCAPVVYIGKISYSIYLTHWPLIVFYQYLLVTRPMAWGDRIVLLGLSILSGMALYHGIESKITWKKIGKKWLWCIGLIVLSVVIALGAKWGYKNIDAFRWRVTGLSVEESAFVGKPYWELDKFGDIDGQLAAVLLADSMGYNYVYGFDNYLTGSGHYLKLAVWHTCWMLDSEYTFNNALHGDSADINHCRNTYQRGISYLEGNNLPLILAQEWMYKDALLQGDQPIYIYPGNDEYYDFILGRLKALRERMGDRKIILIGVPPYHYSNNDERKNTGCRGRPTFLVDVCQFANDETYLIEETYTYRMNNMLREFAQEHPNTYYIDTSDIICPDGICSTKNDDRYYQLNDINHFSYKGSMLVAPMLMQQIEEIIGVKLHQGNSLRQAM